MGKNLILTLRLAQRNIFRNTRRTLLTIMLIASGLAALMFTDAMVKGMSQTLVKISTQTFLGEAQVHQKGFRENYDIGLYIEDTNQWLKQITAIPEISHYTTRTIAGGMLASSQNIAAGMVYGVDAISEASFSKIEKAVIKGHFLTGAHHEVLIGKEMAELLEVELGDRLVITASQADDGELAQELFRVSGIFSFNDRLMDTNLAFINLAQSQQMLGLKHGVHEIALKFQEIESATNTSLPLWSQLNTDQLETLSWYELLPQIGSMLDMSEFSTLFVASILFVLVALGLINSMFMSIYERHYEFGILLAVGTRPVQLFWQILFEGFLIGLLSIGVGMCLGGLLTYWKTKTGIDYVGMEMSGVTLNEPIYLIMDSYQFTHLPLWVLAMTVIACIYPAIHAARMQPTIAMRKAL